VCALDYDPGRTPCGVGDGSTIVSSGATSAEISRRIVVMQPSTRPTCVSLAFVKVAAVRGNGYAGASAARLAHVAGQAALLSVIYLACSAIVEVLRVPVPSNLLALLLLLVLLTTGLLRLGHVEELACFLLRHLAFFFVPFMVGLVAQGALLASAGAALLVSLIVAAGVGIVVAGLAAQATVRWTGAVYADDR
jgi:holin-like protein